MNSFKKVSLIAALSFPMLALSGGAQAGDVKNLSGAHCDPIGPSTSFTRSVSGGISNDDTSSSLTVLCPIVRDNNIGRNPATTTGSFVVVTDNSSTGDVSCTLSSRSQLGGTQSSQSVSTSGQNSAPVVKTFSSVSSATNGYYVLSCTIPARSTAAGQGTSRVITYGISEF
ncbi:MAG: hypothetical protein ACT4QA_13660 [Panacagrimonas sp.]